MPTTRPRVLLNPSTYVSAIALVLLAGEASAAELVSQSIEGTSRVCVYQGDGQARLPGTRPLRSVAVGLGEPCPTRYPDIARPEEAIPAGARLVSRRNVGATTQCTYAFLGRNYVQQFDRGAPCPAVRAASSSAGNSR